MSSRFFRAKSEHGPDVTVSLGSETPSLRRWVLPVRWALRPPGSFGGVVMHPVLLGIALGTQLVVQVSGDIPNFNLEKACKVLSEKVDQGYKDWLTDAK